mmetsp:Transcript_9553/g.31196  ORF Transcript_9553/g.31196 Transcript_9553/m.31196 type:complete len:268 (+) Transcript_9553:435-1238(+)
MTVGRALTTADQLRILGNIWAFWSCPTDRINSFRKVGITEHGLNPDNIDRSKFVMVPPPSVSKKRRIETVVESPEGVEKGSAAYWKAKYEDAKGIIKLQSEREVDPKEAGILPVVQRQNTTKNMSRIRITDGHGSATMSNLLQQREAQRTDKERQAQEKKAKADERAKKKNEKNANTKALWDAFQLCKDGCVCDDLAPGVEACEASKMKLRPYCGELKKRACSKKKCREQKQKEEEEAEEEEDDYEGEEDDEDDLGDEFDENGEENY